MLVTLFSVILIILALLSGYFMLWHLPTTTKKDDQSLKFPSISIIIPARNEEKRIVPLLLSLEKQNTKPHEIIVVDDDSTDKTAEVAQLHGAKVIRVNKEEQDTMGKSMACWLGTQQATGEWFLFLDADTVFKNADSLGVLLATYQNLGSRGLLSVQPYHIVKRLYENLSIVFNVVIMAGMNVFTPLGERLPSAGAFGPCILCNREDYQLTGGHEAIKEALMDDLAIGKAFQKNNLPVYCYSGRDDIQFQMYPEGLNQLIEGWTKSFALGSIDTHPLVLGAVILWVSGGFSTVGLIGYGLYSNLFFTVIIGIGLTLVYFLQFYWLARKVGDFPWWILLFYPILEFFFIVLFLWSLFRVKVLKTVIWRGRKLKV